MVLLNSRGIPRVPRYSGKYRENYDFRLRDYHPLWFYFPENSTNRNLCNSLGVVCPPRYIPRPPLPQVTELSVTRGLGSSHFARRYSGNRFFFLFLRVLRCFSSPRSPHQPIHSTDDDGVCSIGFPHSEILGSQVGSTFPRLIAATPRPSSPSGTKASTICP